jgi:Dolichyl-phosphate-mannose-protein mannosyltransferase
MSEQVPANSASLRASELPSDFRFRAGAAVALAIVAVAAAGLGFFYARGLTNLYGDGIAHMEGARRLTDSLTPGYAEIGTVWLPLYHLLVAPLAMNDFLWRTGLGGSLVSSAAFAVAAWLVYRMAAAMNRNLASGIVALAAFLLCPSMMYLAATPLTEPLMLMWTVLTVYGLFRFQETGKRRALLAAAVAAFLGALTRYDGWFLLPFAALFVFLARREPFRKRFQNSVIFCAIAGAGPALWFLHNAVRFGNPLEFYNGPFSAQAIYARQLATTGFRYPTDGSLLISARYFLADLALVIGPWVLELAVLGLAMGALDVRERARRSAALLLLVPFAFYVQSMAHASVALYVPTLFPHTYYNLRYGIEMLPAAAIFLSFPITSRISARGRAALAAVILVILLGQTVSQFSSGVRELPVVKESLLNTPCKSAEERAVIGFFRAHYDGAPILISLGGWPCLMPEVGIPFHKTVTESNRKIWKQLPQNPGKWVEWILRGKDDSVDELMRAYPAAFNRFELAERDQFPQGQWFEIYRRKSP